MYTASMLSTDIGVAGPAKCRYVGGVYFADPAEDKARSERYPKNIEAVIVAYQPLNLG
jgi:hypothetical protein